MQRHRSHGGTGAPVVESKSTVMTRSRSHSASSSRSTNTGSSSSGSSSSGSSSSSSSGSGSDSSSSDTEGSQVSQGSRNSRASRSSQKRSVSSVKPVPTSISSVATKVQAPVSSSSSSKKKTAGTVSSQSTLSQKTSSSQNHQPKNEKSRVVTSGTVKNIKPQAITKMVQRTFNRKNGLLGSSSESESSSAVTTPVKRVGSKPVAVSIITSKSPVVVPIISSKKKTTPGSNSNHASSSKRPAKKTGKASETVSSTTKNTDSKRLMKTIFSPDNTSDSEAEKRPLPLPKKKSVVTNSKKVPPKEKPVSTNKEKKIKKGGPLTVPNAISSSSLSASGTGTSSNTSTTGSSSDSSSESEKKPESPKLESPSSASRKGASSPKSTTSSARKRPVTRRQRRSVPSKTIPTTTTFNQSRTPESSSLVQPQPQLTLWDSDYSASDDHESRSHARVPAKGSHKTKPRPTDDEEDMMERERKCPFPCCDSSGHLSGKFPTHSMLSTCPKYQGFSPEECKENAEERETREAERLKYFNPAQPHQKKPNKLSTDAKNWVSKMKDLKERQTKDGLCSEYDMTLWVDALAGAAAKIETEQAAGISYRSVAVGKFEMSCWCDSPYPAPLNQSRRLFICEFCLKPVQSGTVLRRHCAKCVWRHPPGDEIYRKDRLSVWEVDGKNQKTYCQNLCLLAKCFLDHKTLYVDVDPFLFYVMTLADSQGCHLVGYFSKEKNSFLNYNVSCILTLPPYQRQGFGRLLIDFSYLLTRVEGKVGSPEKPLSDLGLISYRSYWKDAVLCRMCSCATREMIVKDLSIELGVTSADLISTLQFLGMLKYWKGKHIVLKKQDVLEEYTERLRKKGETRQIDPTMLRWRPYQPPAETSS